MKTVYFAIVLVTRSLVMAWPIPCVTSIMAVSFVGTCLVSLSVRGVR